MDISDVVSEDHLDHHHKRPQYIRTSKGKVYKMKYH
jgi:hypothetical protein